MRSPVSRCDLPAPLSPSSTAGSPEAIHAATTSRQPWCAARCLQQRVQPGQAHERLLALAREAGVDRPSHCPSASESARNRDRRPEAVPLSTCHADLTRIGGRHGTLGDQWGESGQPFREHLCEALVRELRCAEDVVSELALMQGVESRHMAGLRAGVELLDAAPLVDDQVEALDDLASQTRGPGLHQARGKPERLSPARRS